MGNEFIRQELSMMLRTLDGLSIHPSSFGYSPYRAGYLSTIFDPFSNNHNPIIHHHLNMPPPSAQPLKVPATPSKSTEFDKDKTPVASKQQIPSKLGTIAPSDISSPHELTAFVETLLEQLDSKFDDMSKQILDRMNQMSTRVDALEASIQDIINGDISVPQSPSPATPGGIRRSDSGLQ